ncbi:MAG: SH3 domain-containing protein [Longimicrobiaceae bacterium]
MIRNTSISPLRIVIAVVCFVAIVAAATRATWEPARSARVLGPLNVRSGPGTEYPVVGHASPGETIEISHPDTRGWAAVRRGAGTVGYVRALPRYVRIDEAPEPRSAGGAGVWWVAGGLAAAGALVLNRGRSRRMSAPVARAWTADISPADPWPQGHTAHSGFAAATAAAPEPVDDASERNGREFEHWAARRLGTVPFHLIDWRGDKYVDGVFAESTLAPDLLVEYRDGPERTRYAVECKWRRRFWDDVLWWGEWKHLHRYQRYAADQKVPVYLLLGVGGSGEAPDEVYLVPLEAVHYPKLFVRELRKHDRASGEDDIVFDVCDGRLRLFPVAR